MKRSAKWLGNLGVLVALAAGLVVWIMLPWWGVLAVAVLLGLWLVLTRSGRLAPARFALNVSSVASSRSSCTNVTPPTKA